MLSLAVLLIYFAVGYRSGALAWKLLKVKAVYLSSDFHQPIITHKINLLMPGERERSSVTFTFSHQMSDQLLLSLYKYSYVAPGSLTLSLTVSHWAVQTSVYRTGRTAS